MEVIATFWSRPAIICGATMSLLSSSNWIVGRLAIGRAERNRVLAEAVRNDQRDGRAPSFDRGFRGGRGVFGLLGAFHGAGRVFTDSDPHSPGP